MKARGGRFRSDGESSRSGYSRETRRKGTRGFASSNSRPALARARAYWPPIATSAIRPALLLLPRCDSDDRRGPFARELVRGRRRSYATHCNGSGRVTLLLFVWEGSRVAMDRDACLSTEADACGNRSVAVEDCISCRLGVCSLEDSTTGGRRSDELPTAVRRPRGGCRTCRTQQTAPGAAVHRSQVERRVGYGPLASARLRMQPATTECRKVPARGSRSPRALPARRTGQGPPTPSDFRTARWHPSRD